jgi:hypothetical protein
LKLVLVWIFFFWPSGAPLGSTLATTGKIPKNKMRLTVKRAIASIP